MEGPTPGERWEALAREHGVLQYGPVEDVEVLLVECIDCPEYLKVRAEGRTDEEAKAYFEGLGWTILPTRCPSCATYRT